MSEPILRTLTVPVEYAGQRLDQVLAELLSDFSRTRIKEWIEAGQVLVDGEKLRPKDKVLGGEQVRVSAPSIEEAVGRRAGADRAGDRPPGSPHLRAQQARRAGRASRRRQRRRHPAERAAAPGPEARAGTAGGHRASARQGHERADGRRSHARSAHRAGARHRSARGGTRVRSSLRWA